MKTSHITGRLDLSTKDRHFFRSAYPVPGHSRPADHPGSLCKSSLYIYPGTFIDRGQISVRDLKISVDNKAASATDLQTHAGKEQIRSDTDPRLFSADDGNTAVFQNTAAAGQDPGLFRFDGDMHLRENSVF